jgi:itaconate CoA-transferase
VDGLSDVLRLRRRGGAAHATIFPYGPFPTGDGGSIMLGLQNEREWRTFCERVLRQPALADDARFGSNAARVAARAALRAIIVEAFAGLSATAVRERLDEAGIANAQVNDMAQVWAHPQLQARARWVPVDTAAGPIPALLPPGAGDAGTVRMDAVPALGEHSRAILTELGYEGGEIEQLMREGAG